jgi:hypothetical protein
MSDYDKVLQEALSEAARALGVDRGTRSESIADRITAIRAERDALQTKLERVEDALRKEAYGSQWCVVCHGAREVLDA